NGDGEVTPTEIIEENNYYPFGLRHQGYNELATDAHQYKFLDREYQPELGLNTIATDYRHYDPAIGRFNVMDAMSELAPGQTPYRYGFNNPINWTDPSGLFESKLKAKAFAIEELGLSDGQYSIESLEGSGFVLHVNYGEFDGRSFYYGMIDNIIDELVINSGGGGGSKGDSSNDGNLGMTIANGIIGAGSTYNIIPSGYLKYNNVWHKTKTRGVSFSFQSKWKNSGAKYWRAQQVKPFQNARDVVGKRFARTSGSLVIADIAMSGEFKPSHVINATMIGISGTGFGSIVAGIWYIADYGTGAYNYFFTDDGF